MAAKKPVKAQAGRKPAPVGRVALYDAVQGLVGDATLRREQVERVVRRTFEAITAFLRRGQTVILPGFGTFYPSTFKGGTVRLPGGGTKRLRPHRIPRFRPGEALKQAVRRG